MTMQTVVREINTEYDTRLDEIKSDTAYDVLEMSGSRAVWKEIGDELADKVLCLSEAEVQADMLLRSCSGNAV